MNVERINKCIRMMEGAKNLYMNTFQSCSVGRTGVTDYVKTTEELHACGNTACFAGYLAISPFFIEDGGQSDAGVPCFNNGTGSGAVAAYLGISKVLANSIVYGEDNQGLTLEDFQAYGRDIKDFTGLYGTTPFHEVKPRHVIRVLKRILSGELK